MFTGKSCRAGCGDLKLAMATQKAVIPTWKSLLFESAADVGGIFSILPIFPEQLRRPARQTDVLRAFLQKNRFMCRDQASK